MVMTIGLLIFIGFIGLITFTADGVAWDTKEPLKRIYNDLEGFKPSYHNHSTRSFYKNKNRIAWWVNPNIPEYYLFYTDDGNVGIFKFGKDRVRGGFDHCVSGGGFLDSTVYLKHKYYKHIKKYIVEQNEKEMKEISK